MQTRDYVTCSLYWLLHSGDRQGQQASCIMYGFANTMDVLCVSKCYFAKQNIFKAFTFIGFFQLNLPVQSLIAHSNVLLVQTDENTVPVTKALYLILTTSLVTVH